MAKKLIGQYPAAWLGVIQAEGGYIPTVYQDIEGIWHPAPQSPKQMELDFYGLLQALRESAFHPLKGRALANVWSVKHEEKRLVITCRPRTEKEWQRLKRARSLGKRY